MDLGFGYPMGSVANFLISLNKFIGFWPTFFVYLTTLAIGLVISFWDSLKIKKKNKKLLNHKRNPQDRKTKNRIFKTKIRSY